MNNSKDEILKNGYIYKCWSNTDDKIYYGSCKNLDNRIASHNKMTNTSQTIYINGDLIFETIELHRDISVYNLKQRERFFIESHKDDKYLILNKNIPNRTKKEYSKIKYDENPQLFCAKQKVYYYSNQEKEKKRLKKYNKEKSGTKWFCKDCNHIYSWTSKYDHLKTQKHLSNIPPTTAAEIA
tara:strand:+ start:2095 stop:2643 length:549 start_codon:yes stop_codon:yes gene_type:complete